MRSFNEIKEAHGFMKAAYDSAVVDGNEEEAKLFATLCHALIWVTGHGEIFEKALEEIRIFSDYRILELEKFDES